MPPDEALETSEEMETDEGIFIESAEDEPEESEDEPGDDEETEEEPEEEPEQPEWAKEKAELESRLEKTEREKNWAAAQLRKLQQDTKPSGDDKKVHFTDEQIVGIIQEHQDDPAVLLQVFKQVAKQEGEGLVESKVKNQEITRFKESAEEWLRDRVPDFFQDDSPVRAAVEKMKPHLGLDDHPMADILTLGQVYVANIDAIRKEEYERGRKEALGETAETRRKQGIKNTKPAPAKKGGTSTGHGLTASQLETAKNLGLEGDALKNYAAMLKKSGTVTVGD